MTLTECIKMKFFIFAIILFQFMNLAIADECTDNTNKIIGTNDESSFPLIITLQDSLKHIINEEEASEIVLSRRTLFDQGFGFLNQKIGMIYFQYNSTELFLTEGGERVFIKQVSKDNLRFVERKSITVSGISKTGGIGQQLYVKESEVKDFLAAVPVRKVKTFIAIEFKILENGLPLYVVFKDEMVKGKIEREVYQYIYPRKYRISLKVAAKLHTKHNITLSDLDAIYGHWDGIGYQSDSKVHISGVILDIQRENTNIYTSLVKLENGQTYYLVLEKNNSSKLPIIISCFRPTESNVEIIKELLSHTEPVRLVDPQ
jgi:hypothetical protein